MDDFTSDRLSATLDLFILKRLNDDGPLSVLEIEQRIKPIHSLLNLFATRKGKQGPGSLLTALQRLHRDGWLKAEPKPDTAPESALVHSLTELGEQRVKEGSARLESMLSEFVEDRNIYKSLRKSLDRRKSIDQA